MLYDVNDLDYLEVYLISAICAFMGTYGTFFVLLNRIRAPPRINLFFGQVDRRNKNE